MKHIYNAILIAAMSVISGPAAFGVNPEDLDVPEETWEIHYDSYQSLWNDDPAYKDLSRTVTIKRDSGLIYIRGIFEEYPDAWVSGRYSDRVMIFGKMELLPAAENTEYLQVGKYSLVSKSNTDREYTIGILMEPSQYMRWTYADNGENNDLLVPQYSDNAIWISSKPDESESITKTFYFDGPSTGDDFGLRPIYLYPTFHKISSSGIMDTVIEQKHPEDTRVFDLSGRQVNPDRLTPGIYIRAGRKFIVR